MFLAVLVTIASVGAGVHSPAARASVAVQDERPFSLAVLRRDGLVIPFAVFDDGWKTPWPAGLPPELPISLTDVPQRWWGVDEPFPRMAIWREGQRVGEVTLTGVTTTRLMCQPRVVLRSDYKASAPIPPSSERPHPKDGLLVGGGAQVDRIESVQRGAPEWNRVMVAMTPEFNKAETAAAGNFSSWRHPVGTDDRRLVPITIESLYRAPSDQQEWTAYFVEAVRQYPPGKQDKDGCGPVTYAYGWVMLDTEDRSWVRLGAGITYCDRFGVRYMYPFGTVKAKDRIYWLFQFAGAEAEGYEVVRPRPNRIESVAAFNAGVCR